MNPREQEDHAFDQLADRQLKRLERALISYDPDELEAEKPATCSTSRCLPRPRRAARS